MGKKHLAGDTAREATSAMSRSAIAAPAMSGIVVEKPVHLLGLQRLVEPLQQTELGRGAIADPDMAEVGADMGAKALGEERRTVVGDQER